MFELGNMSTRHSTLSLDFIDALAKFVAVAAHDPLCRHKHPKNYLPHVASVPHDPKMRNHAKC